MAGRGGRSIRAGVCAHRVSFGVPGVSPPCGGVRDAPLPRALSLLCPPGAPQPAPAPGPSCLSSAVLRAGRLFCLFSLLSSLWLQKPIARSSRLRREFHLQRKGGRPRTAPAPPATPPTGEPTPPAHPAPAFVRPRKPAESSLMHPFQWCNGESGALRGSGVQGTWGWPEPRRGGRQVSDRRGPSPSRAKFYCNGTDEEASWRSTLLCTARNLKGGEKNPGFTPGPRRISRAGGGRGSRGAPGLCVAAPRSYPLPSSALCAPTLVLCCGCRRRIKSALGLGSPRGSSSSWSETLQAILNMYTMQRAGRGAGAASPAPLLASHRLLRGFVPGDDAGLMTCLYWIDKAV